MREILFRGKRLDNGEWVEGNLFVSDTDGSTYILAGSRIVTIEWSVNHSTVGQYTGLKDKDGKRIFEGDVLRYSYDYPGSPWMEAKGLSDKDIAYQNGDVYWQEWRGTWAVGVDVGCHAMNQDVFTYCRNPNRVEVIGNIHDNPELLGGKFYDNQ